MPLVRKRIGDGPLVRAVIAAIRARTILGIDLHATDDATTVPAGRTLAEPMVHVMTRRLWWLNDRPFMRAGPACIHHGSYRSSDRQQTPHSLPVLARRAMGRDAPADH